MNTLYDISVLALGFSKPLARTGVTRVIENVAEHLALQSECNLKFCCSIHPAWIEDSVKYLQTNKKLSRVQFSIPPEDLKYETTKKRFELIEVVENANNLSIKEKLKNKILIRALWMKEKFGDFKENSAYLIHPNDLKEANIYHSTFFPIPKQVRDAKKKKEFLTIYDLIPILYPQYAEKEMRVLIKEVVESITPKTWVFCISKATRNDLLNYLGKSANPDRVLVTELAASHLFYRSNDADKHTEVKNKYNIPDAPYILSVCTLEPRKNIDQVIKGFVRMVHQEKMPDLNLILVGAAGWMFDKIFEEIEASAGIKSRIIITGFVADEDLAALYTDALMFVYPSFYEGFGLPPLEAMQCGTPVITSNTSSLPEVVGDAGIMIAPTDLDALCEAMLSIYKSPFLREDLSRRSLERANKFSWEKCAQATVDAYKLSLS